jgi:hypothetical protein
MKRFKNSWTTDVTSYTIWFSVNRCCTLYIQWIRSRRSRSYIADNEYKKAGLSGRIFGTSLPLKFYLSAVRGLAKLISGPPASGIYLNLWGRSFVLQLSSSFRVCKIVNKYRYNWWFWFVGGGEGRQACQDFVKIHQRRAAGAEQYR